MKLTKLMLLIAALGCCMPNSYAQMHIGLTTNPFSEWSSHSGNIKVHLQPTYPWGKNIGLVGGFGYLSEEKDLQNETVQYEATAYAEAQIRFFPFGRRSDFKKRSRLDGCYSFKKSEPIKPLAGIWLGVGHQWKKHNLTYKLLESNSGEPVSLNYENQANALLFEGGYQIRYHHIIFGVSYRAKYTTNIKNSYVVREIFALSPNAEFAHGIKFEVGIFF